MKLNNKLHFIIGIILLLLMIVIIWQLLQVLRSHQLSTNAEHARKAGLPIPVSTVLAESGELDSVVAAECVAKESARAVLSTDVGGSVIKISAGVGDAVSKDQLLVKLDDVVQQSLLENTRQAEKTLELLREELEPFTSDMRKLRKQSVVPVTDLLDAIDRQRRAELDLIRVRKEKIQAVAEINSTEIISPISGVLTDLEVDKGTVARAYEDIAVVSQLDPLMLICEFAMDMLPEVKDFDRAQASFPAYSGMAYEVVMKKILPVADKDSHAVIAQFTLANPGHKLLPGMQAIVRLSKHIEGIKIPATSLINREGDSATIFVIDETQRAGLVKVVTGRYAEGYIEVKNGLSSGQRVVVAGQILLQHGDEVTDPVMASADGGADKSLLPDTESSD